MSSKSAATSESLLDELQATLAHGTVARRVETLRRVTDLFINGAVDYSSEQIGLFDDVFQCLVHHIETSAKALLATRLAPIDSAPPLTIRALAFDDLIEVAAPVLSRSERLEIAHPQQAGEVPTAVREATQLARSAPSAITRDTAIAHALVKSLYEDGRLDEFQVAAFAEAGKFDEANAAIAALANVPVTIAENMMVETRAEGVMILAKISGMTWSTVRAIINMRDDLSGMEPSDLMTCKATYERLRPSTAQQVLRFHRMQQATVSAA